MASQGPPPSSTSSKNPVYLSALLLHFLLLPTPSPNDISPPSSSSSDPVMRLCPNWLGCCFFLPSSLWGGGTEIAKKNLEKNVLWIQSFTFFSRRNKLSSPVLIQLNGFIMVNIRTYIRSIVVQYIYMRARLRLRAKKYALTSKSLVV